MDWWQKMVFPVRRVWLAISARVRTRKHGGGLLKLRNDVQTCGYEDVQVMWEMLRRFETETSHSSKRKRLYERLLIWPSRTSSSRAKLFH
ncbi:unnamed protein product [Victoria cruziana]